MTKKIQHTFTLFTAVFLFALFVAGCQKSATVRWVYYEETYCADRWEYSSNNEMLKDNIVSYLDSRGITAHEIEIFRLVEAESCTECTCKTGRQIKCKIRKSDLDDALNEGFHE